MADRSETASIATLFNNLLRDMSTLIRQEVELARTETTEKVGEAGRSVTSMVIGGAIAYAGLLFLLLAAVFALELIMDAWLAALIVGAVVAIVGFIMFRTAQSKLRPSHMKPERTIESLRDDAAMVRHQVRGQQVKE